ncbi:MAG: GNAT family N-acetyltransferase [Gallionellaceae bacterium]
MINKDIAFMAITDKDIPFLMEVYASTREEEFKITDWPDAEKEAFIKMQFTFQHTQYMENYKNKEFSIIMYKGDQVGRLYLNRMEDDIRIVDITILTKHRGKGIGTPILQNILKEGAETNRCVTIHLEKFNPAITLYERLGFKKIADREVHHFMEWKNKD